MDEKLRDFHRRLIAARKSLIESIGRSNFIMAYEDLKIEGNFNHPCFGILSAALRNFNPPSHNSELKYFIDWSFPHKKQFTIEEIDYFNYIVTESPWKNAFITKRLDKAYKKGINYNIDYPPEYIIQAAIWIRMINEFPDLIKIWTRLSKHLDKKLSLIFSLYSGYINEQYFSITTDYNYFNNTNHYPLDKDGLTRRMFMNIFAKKIITQNSSFRKRKYYSRLSNIWGKRKKEDILLKIPTIKRSSKEYIKGVGVIVQKISFSKDELMILFDAFVKENKLERFPPLSNLENRNETPV